MPMPRNISQQISERAFASPSNREISRVISPPGRNFGVPTGASGAVRKGESLVGRFWTKDGQSHTIGPFDDEATASATLEAMAGNMKGTDTDEIVDWTVERQPYGFVADVAPDDLMG